jgi:hypothetical protein
MTQLDNNPNTTDLITPEQPYEVAKLLDGLPGMIGAIDQAVIDTTGKRLPFVLLVFPEKGAVHATNIHPASEAVNAVKQLAAQWEAAEA